MKVAITHDLVMPRWMVFCKIICHVELAFTPYDLKLLIVDAIVEPMEPHIEGLGEFRTNRSSENASSSGVVIE